MLLNAKEINPKELKEAYSRFIEQIKLREFIYSRVFPVIKKYDGAENSNDFRSEMEHIPDLKCERDISFYEYSISGKNYSLGVGPRIIYGKIDYKKTCRYHNYVEGETVPYLDGDFELDKMCVVWNVALKKMQDIREKAFKFGIGEFFNF